MYDTGNNGDMVQDGSIEMVTMINAALLVYPARRACALRALGLLLADGAPTVGRGKTLTGQPFFFTKTAVTLERKVKK